MSDESLNSLLLTAVSNTHTPRKVVSEQEHTHVLHQPVYIYEHNTALADSQLPLSIAFLCPYFLDLVTQTHTDNDFRAEEAATTSLRRVREREREREREEYRGGEAEICRSFMHSSHAD